MTEVIQFDKILQNNYNSFADTDFANQTEEMARVQWKCFKSDWFVCDGLGISCAVITYGLIFFAEFVVIGVILLPGFPTSFWGYVHAILFTLISLLAAASHLRAMTTDPGTIPRGNFTEENVRSEGFSPGDVVVRCTKCECIKTDRAHHCSTCQRCIRKMDHHCPWINNCVGESNQKFFMLFAFYIMSASGYALGLSIRYMFSCSEKDWDNCSYFSPPASVIFVVFLVFEGLLFGLFTMVMLCTQVNSVVTDETGIEHLKKEQFDSEGNWRTRMQDVFGGKFSLSWFSPFSGVPMSRRRRNIEVDYRNV